MKDKTHESGIELMATLRESGVIYDGMTIMLGGFGLCGIPEQLIIGLRDTGVRDITCISNNAGVDDWGLGLLLQTRQIKKMVSSYVGENEIFERQFIDGELEVEFNPQGTLAERIRAGGAGIPAFYTATGAGTLVAEGKQSRPFLPPSASARAKRAGLREREYVMETGLYADLSLVKAEVGDTFGNLVYRMTARNFNADMARAAAHVVAEVERVVPLGEIDPDHVHTPGSYVDQVVQSPGEKRIEQRTTR